MAPLARAGIDRLAHNPFWILGVAPTASPLEVERAGQKLLAMLQVGLSEARTVDTPFGRRLRDADDVREALAELRDPGRRARWELWARCPAPHPPGPTPPAWPDALRALGWR